MEGISIDLWEGLLGRNCPSIGLIYLKKKKKKGGCPHPTTNQGSSRKKAVYYRRDIS